MIVILGGVKSNFFMDNWCGYFVFATLCDIAPLNLKVSPYGRDDKRWGYGVVTLGLLCVGFFM